MMNKSDTNENLTKKLLILSSKSIQRIREITLLRLVFDPSRYLDWLSRYKGSKFIETSLRQRKNYEWARDLYSFPGNEYYFQELRLLFVWNLRQVSETRRKWEGRVNDKETIKGSKITLLFTRWYLGNRKSYRDKRESVSKGKIPRF